MSGEQWSKRKKVSYDLPEDLVYWLADYCYWENVNRNKIVKEILTEFLADRVKARGEPYPPSPKRKEDTNQGP